MINADTFNKKGEGIYNLTSEIISIANVTTKIILSENHITVIPSDFLPYLIFTEEIDFDKNEISEIGHQAFVTVPNLITLRLKYNNLHQGGPTRGARGARAPPVVGRCPS